jgi:acetyl-CoA/propionyl-CoA carboxylase carboxyl transferase subunit
LSETVVASAAAAVSAGADVELDPRDPVARLSTLLDRGSLELLQEPDEIRTMVAYGRLRGIDVVAFCTDATVKGGAIGNAECNRIADAIDLALLEGRPVVGLWHSGGARLQEGIEAMDGIGRIFAAMVRASGTIPQISIVLGPAAGGAAYGPGLTDVVICAPEGRIFITGPDVIKTVTGEQIGMAELGGAEAHSSKSGVVHIAAESEADAYERARRLVHLMSRPGSFTPLTVAEPKDLNALLPESTRRAYNVKPLIRAVVDGGVYEELQPMFARNMVTALGRLAGGTVGILANNPIRKGGCLDSASAEKAARFVRMCDAFGIPLLVLVDVPGYLPGVREEWDGVVRRGAKLLHAFAEATVPRVTLVTRKSYGGAYIAMNSRSLGATKVFAWPQAEVAVMGAESAVGILHRRPLAAAPDSEREALRARLIEEQRTIAGGVSRGLSAGAIDAVVEPVDTRFQLATALAQAKPARGNHKNIPL